MSSVWSGYRFVACILAAVFIATIVSAVASAKENVLYAFHGGSDGALPFSTLIADGSGNLYGTTSVGGGGSCEFGGCGTIFKLSPEGTESVLYAFTGGNDGAYPFAGLTSDGAGNYYGTTREGGGCAENDTCGTVFRLGSDGTESVRYAFQGGSDGLYPSAGLIADDQGNFYGTTVYGGNYNGADCQDQGCGTVFELTPGDTKTTLYKFQGEDDGLQPLGGVIRDTGGNLYGTTAFGGGGTPCSIGCGTVFKIAPDGSESVLYAFKGGRDGAVPYAGVITDASGDFYGTTSEGGTCALTNCGTIFKLNREGKEIVLYSFQGGSDGRNPEGSLIRDGAGNLYGTTFYGGTRCRGGGCGTVFKLAPDGSETVLFSFFGNHGRSPAAALFSGSHGFLYGTASGGGTGRDGVVFRVKK